MLLGTVIAKGSSDLVLALDPRPSTFSLALQMLRLTLMIDLALRTVGT